MNKFLPYLSFIAILISGVAFYQSNSSEELVYVDVNKLIEGYRGTTIAKAEFEERASTMKTNVDSLLNDWQIELTAYEKERSKLSTKELKLKQELLSNRQQQLSSYQESIQRQIKEEDQKMTKNILNEINNYIHEYGEIHGYKIIFGASGRGNIMYADKNTDLTDDILKGLNEDYAK